MGWGIWILVVLGTGVFWAVILMGLNVLFAGEHSKPPTGSSGDPHLHDPDRVALDPFAHRPAPQPEAGRDQLREDHRPRP